MSKKKCATVSLQASEVALNNEYHGSSAARRQQVILTIGAESSDPKYITRVNLSDDYYAIVSATNPHGAARPVISHNIYECCSDRLVKHVIRVNSHSVDAEVGQ